MGRASSSMGSVKYREGLDFNRVLNDCLKVFFKDALRVALTDPAQAYHFMRTLRWQKKAAGIRSDWQKQGVRVPPMLIFSVTDACNLHCQGCYHRALHRSTRPELDTDKVRAIVTEARDLGVSFIMIAGGEPLLRRDVFDIISEFPEITFLVFTNGLLMDSAMTQTIKKLKNCIPSISLEGEENTDQRRGAGVFERLSDVAARLKTEGIFWSVSLTVTRANFAGITSESFIDRLVGLGCKVFFFVEYTPVSANTENLLVTPEQRQQLLAQRDIFRARHPALFVTIPGDEEEIGGCLSAGKGFIHVNAQGDVEPCPFAPYSDCNLNDMTLLDALKSDLLRRIREHHEHLPETEGGCALWVEREWVKSLLP